MYIYVFIYIYIYNIYILGHKLNDYITPLTPSTTIGEETTIRAKGRHDPCVLPRAVPMVESMVALVLVDQLMQHIAQCNLFAMPVEVNEAGEEVGKANKLGKKLTGSGAI